MSHPGQVSTGLNARPPPSLSSVTFHGHLWCRGQSYTMSPLVSPATLSRVLLPLRVYLGMDRLSKRYRRRDILTGMSLGKHLKVNITLMTIQVKCGPLFKILITLFENLLILRRQIPLTANSGATRFWERIGAHQRFASRACAAPGVCSEHVVEPVWKESGLMTRFVASRAFTVMAPGAGQGRGPGARFALTVFGINHGNLNFTIPN